MDFGDILKKWEAGKRGEPGDGEMSGIEMERLLDLYPPAAGKKEGDVPAGRRLRRATDNAARRPVEDTLDLHGFSGAEAEKALDEFIRTARARKYRKVLIIHGKGIHSKGDPVLGRIVRQYLEACPFAGKIGRPDRSEGGSGAVWVLLK